MCRSDLGAVTNRLREDCSRSPSRNKRVPRMSSEERPAYLKAIEGPVVLKRQDVVRDGEDVAVGGDETPQVDGLSCRRERKPTDKASPSH